MTAPYPVFKATSLPDFQSANANFEEPNPKLNLGPAVPIKKAVNDKIKTLRSWLNRFTMMPALNCFRTFNP
jgi:hypothetical protein